jgi:hypothetical protein
MVGVVAAIKGGDVGGCEARGGVHSRTIRLAEPRVLREQAEANQQVGFTAAHCLFEVKNCLRRSSRQACKALADEVLHALRDVCLLKEGRAIALADNQLVELLDLITEFDRERIVLKLAGVPYSFH